MGFLKNLKEGLFKSSSNISEGVSNIFLKSKPNEKILEEIEDFMIQCDFGIDVASKFKFNGIELEESLGLNLYEMDLRSYDPAIGRWNRIDPVTHYNLSPYNAFDNNPIFFLSLIHI